VDEQKKHRNSIREKKAELGIKSDAVFAEMCGLGASTLQKFLSGKHDKLSETSKKLIDNRFSLGLCDFISSRASVELGGYSREMAESELCGLYKVVWPLDSDFQKFTLYEAELFWDNNIPGIAWKEKGREDWKCHSGYLTQYFPNNIFYFVSRTQRGNGYRICYTQRNINQNFIGFLATVSHNSTPAIPMVSPICFVKGGLPTESGIIDCNQPDVYSWCESTIQAAIDRSQVRFLLPGLAGNRANHPE
jgi:hypothetical protein